MLLQKGLETLPDTWSQAVSELELTLARAKLDDRSGPLCEKLQNLEPLVDLTRQIAATKYGQAYRAGTSLRQSLMISTAKEHSLEPEEPFISVDVERTKQGAFGFCILYFEGGWGNEKLQALVKTYGSDDHNTIELNLRRDLAGYYYPCEFAGAWEILQPLMVRLWSETHSEPKVVQLILLTTSPLLSGD